MIAMHPVLCRHDVLLTWWLAHAMHAVCGEVWCEEAALGGAGRMEGGPCASEGPGDQGGSERAGFGSGNVLYCNAYPMMTHPCCACWTMSSTGIAAIRGCDQLHRINQRGFGQFLLLLALG